MIGIGTINFISEPLSCLTCNKNCCGAFIQIKWVLFPIAINRSSGYNPICWPAISAKLRCFEIPCQVDKVACRTWARIPDVTIPCFDLPNYWSELSSAELWFVKLAYRAYVTDARSQDVNSSVVMQRQYQISLWLNRLQLSVCEHSSVCVQVSTILGEWLNETVKPSGSDGQTQGTGWVTSVTQDPIVTQTRSY